MNDFSWQPIGSPRKNMGIPAKRRDMVSYRLSLPLSLASLLTSNLILALCLIGPFVLFMALTALRDHRLFIPAYFRDEGCDETRESRGWKREKQMEIMGLWLGMSVALALLVFVRGD